MFSAYRATDGQKLWSYPTGNGIIAPPISYTIAGKQYVALLSGYGGPGALAGANVVLPAQSGLPGRLLVFALDARGALPPYAKVEKPVLDLEGVSSAGDAAAGQPLFNYNCIQCHGPSGASNYVAELRRSPIIGSADAFRSVVIDGAFTEKGMDSFADTLTPAQAEDIRAFLIREAKHVAASDAQPAPR